MSKLLIAMFACAGLMAGVSSARAEGCDEQQEGEQKGDGKNFHVEYRNGQKVVMESANGDVSAYRVKLDTVRVGDIAVHNVDAVITESNSLPVALLGMNFLNRMDIRREGAIMTLTKRY